MAKTNTYRKLFVASASTALVAAAVAPAAMAAGNFSDVPSDSIYSAPVNALAEAGVISGFPDGTFRLAASVTRAEASKMVSIIRGLDTENTVAAPFDDVKQDAWYAKYINSLYGAKLINGLPNGDFGPNETMTRAQFAKLVFDAYGLEKADDVELPFTDVKADAWYTPYLKALYANGLIKGVTATTFAPNNNIKRGDFTLLLSNVDNYTPTPKVVSVSAANAKTIEVKFNKAVDAKTLVKNDTDVITVVAGEGATASGNVTQKLSADGKTLTLTATNIFKGDYTVKVPFEIVKDVDGEFVSPMNAKVTVNDKTAPVLTAATSTIKDTKDGLKKITLSFDEEVTSIDTVKINGMNYSAAVNGKEATVVVDLDATKTYDVKVVNATDAAGNVKDVQEATVSVTVDSAAPSILNVVPAGENKVTVTLDKELANDTLTITGKVANFTANVVTKAEVNPKNKKEYTVTLNSSYLFKKGNSDTVTLTVAKEALVDALGNKNAAEITKTVVVSKDATAPQVVKVATSTTEGKVTSFSVTYNEEVANPTTAKVAVVNSKGEILPVSSVVSKAEVSATDAKTVVFTLVDGLATGKYSFDLAEGFAVDKALTPNESAKYAFQVDVTEAGKPVETSFTITDASAEANVITVDFGAKVKATGTGSALNPSAYQVNGVALPADTVIAFAKKVDASIDQTKVVITLPEGFVKANDDKAIFRINAVQTLDNKVSNQFSKIIAVTDNTAPEVKSIVATDLTEVTVTYSEAIKLTDLAVAADIQDEIKLVDSKGAAIAFTAAVVTDGKLVLTVADATKVNSLTTVAVDAQSQDIVDLNNVAQKAGVTVSK